MLLILQRGDFALSIRHKNRIHHFPIKTTEAKEYYIGEHNFKTIYNIIIYYKKNFLFYDENKAGVKLGKPLTKLNEVKNMLA